MEKYTHNALIPQFEPSGRKVSLEELVNIDRYTALINKLNISLSENRITHDEYKFLVLGATRFLEFSYSNIAEYYCNASSEMQKLMEEELLVLLDINNRLTESVTHTKKFIDDFKEKWINENNSEEMKELF